MKLVWLQSIHSLQQYWDSTLTAWMLAIYSYQTTHSNFTVNHAGRPTSVNGLGQPMWTICNFRLCITQNILCSSSCSIGSELESLHVQSTSAIESSIWVLHDDKPGNTLVQPIWLCRLSSQCCSYVQHIMHTLRTSSGKKQAGTVSFVLPPSV